MSSCNLFNDSLINIVGGISGFSINKIWLQSLIPAFNADTSGIWRPIFINHTSSKSEYGGLLSNPQKINDSITDSCNCQSVGRRLARNTILAYNDFSEDPENGVLCDYCQKLYGDTTTGVMNCKVNVNYRPIDILGEDSTIQWPLASLSPVPIGSGEDYSVTCCSGGCDTRMLTDDIVPKIPYLSNSYINKFFDFKHLQQFPSIENPGLGIERFGSYTGPTDRLTLSNATVHFDWILKPRLGELPPSKNDTYHTNPYVHEKSYSRYLLNNKTCGNFILKKLNAPTPITMWQSGHMPALSGSPLLSGLVDHRIAINNLIPTTDQFAMPYGITNDTHYNIFLKSPDSKQGGFWKWNFTSGVLCWYRYYDKNRANDKRVIPGVDLYISPGDVFYAKNDGPEPLAKVTGDPEPCKHRVCPSGLKMTKYQTTSTTGTVTIVPSGSEFLYISNNLYPHVRALSEFLIEFLKNEPNTPSALTYGDVLDTAAILATGPLYSEITIDLFKFPSGYSPNIDIPEYVNILNVKGQDNYKYFTSGDVSTWFSDPGNVDKVRDQYYRLKNLDKRLTNKLMPSYNNLNMIVSTGDLVNTLVDKYGLYLWVPPDTNASITLNTPIYPHAYFDIDFEPVVKLRDTRCSISSSVGQPKNCNLQLRGRTKIFGYDQEFEIGESKLKATILDDNLVYAAEYIGNPPVRTITDVSATMSTYFRGKQIYSTAFGSYQTSIANIYSRFPSVSSSLDTTFSNLADEQDGFGDIGVFFLENDAQYRFNRKYDGFCAHPNINLAGFHEDGGFYYESTLLSRTSDAGTVGFQKNWRPPRARNNPIIKFTTYDLGIKLYSIDINRLRNVTNTNCKTFPLQQSCGCWGINKVTNFPFKCGDTVVYETSDLFTPFLSTQNVPMMAYGGFDEDKVNSYLGDFRIPNHPNIGSNLPSINKVIDPANVNGCTSTASISLPNYVSSEWKLEIPNFNTTGASIWVKLNDSFSFATDRTQNKVVINGQEIFPNEQKPLETSSNTLNISIHNQFLSNVADGNLYHPDMYSCSLDKTDPYVYTPKYKKPSNITLTFGRVPNATVLGLKMPGIQPMGRLTKTFFDPNIGLQSSYSRGSALSIDKFNGLFNFDYGQRLFQQNNTYSAVSPNDISLSGSMPVSSLGKLLAFINTKNDTKKLRLYLKINNKWYEYEDHHTFGYFNTQEQQQYHSWPTFFTECHLQTDQALGPFIPAIPKVPLEHIYCTNAQTWQNIVYRGDAPYPYFDHKFIRSPIDNKKILIKGSRAWFLFPNMSGLTQDQKNNQYLFNVINEEKFGYRDVTNQTRSITYAWPVEPTTIYSISQLDIDKYRADASKRANISDNFNLPAEVRPNKIVSKRILRNIEIYATGDKNQSLVDAYNNIYTEFTLEQDHPHSEGYIYLLKSGEMPITNLTILPTTRAFNVPNSELIRFSDDPNNRNVFSNKWGDLIYYNNTTDILNNKPYYDSINDVYGPFLYDSTLNYIIANNFMYSHQIPTSSGTVNSQFPLNLYVQNTGSSGLVSFNNPKLHYYVHQPFSLGNPVDRYERSSSRYNLFKNQNPVMDINIYETGSASDRAFVKASIQEYDPTGIGMTGILFISGIYRPTYESTKLISDNFNFFINLNNHFYLKPTPVTDSGLIAKSLVITDTYTTLDTILLNSTIQSVTNRNCTNIVIPSIGTTIASPNSVFDWTNFAKTSTTGAVYANYPILCDSDIGGECGSATVCSLSIIGNLAVSSKYNNYKYKYKNLNDITSDDIEYSISVDAGLYCPLRTSGDMPYIVRSEIAGYSAAFPTRSLDGTSSCVDGNAYPPLGAGLSVWDDNFQFDVSSNIVDNRPVDHWANEVLFRSIHGSTQNINLADISSAGSASAIKNYGDILQTLISNPNDTLSVLYDSIPYDYDTSATAPNFKLQGAIRIYGPAAIGDKISITFNDTTYNISIKDNGNDVYVECPELEATGLIMEKSIESRTIYVREQGTVSSFPGASERVITTCHSPSSYGVGVACINPGDKSFTASRIEYYSASRCFTTFCKGDTPVVQPGAAFNSPQISNPVSCSAFPKDTASSSSASPLDSFFTKYGASLGILGGQGLAGTPLECIGYNINTCRVKEGCCDGETQNIKTVSYRIKDCHYDFTMYGLVTKSINNIGQLVNNNTATIPCATPFSDAAGSYDAELAYINEIAPKCCDCTSGGDYEKYPKPDDCPGLRLYCCKDYCNGELNIKQDDNCNKISIECSETYRVQASYSPSVTYEVVEAISTNTSNSNLYDPNVIRTICTFIFDNNEIKLYAGIAQTRNGVEVYNGGNCSSTTTSSCPSIRISLPNSSYGIDDTVSSSCQNCSNQSEKIKILENPRWESQIDTVYCLLGSSIIGGSNNGPDYTLGFGCTPITPENRDAWYSIWETYDRGRSCGQPVNRSCTPWHHFASNPALGTDSVPFSKCGESVVVENAYYVNFPDWTTSSEATEVFTGSFKARMEEIYRNQHYCTNSYEYSEDQLIEGVIPGSCSLEFANITWPGIAVKLCASAGGNDVTAEVTEEEISIKVIIAYMKYKYKHPLNIFDKIIDEQGAVSSSDCRVYFSAGGATGCRKKYFGNMKEELKSTERRSNNCTSSPNCYDKTRPCDPNNGCCGIDVNGINYLI